MPPQMFQKWSVVKKKRKKWYITHITITNMLGDVASPSLHPIAPHAPDLPSLSLCRIFTSPLQQNQTFPSLIYVLLAYLPQSPCFIYLSLILPVSSGQLMVNLPIRLQLSRRRFLSWILFSVVLMHLKNI